MTDLLMDRASENTTASMESLLGEVADEFTQRLNRGEQPDIEEYAARYPRIDYSAASSAARLAALAGPGRRRCGGGHSTAGHSRRLPHPPRSGPRRHGRGLRSRANFPGPPRGLEGPAFRWRP